MEKHKFVPVRIPFYAIYENDDGSKFCLPVVGFDVRTFSDGSISVVPLDVASDGLCEMTSDNCCGFTYDKNERG